MEEFKHETNYESHFVVEVEGENILSVLVGVDSLFKIDKPKLFVSEDGKMKWKKMNLYFKDYIGPSISQALMEAWREDSLNGIKFFINNLDQVDNVITQRWEVVIKEIVEIDFGDLDAYSDKESVVKVTIEIEEAILRF